MLSAEKRKDGLAQLLLLLSSFGIYLYHFRNIFFRLNEVLSGVTLDSIKNYYTFIYHIKHDASPLRFDGMNYPFSEHVIYSDSQPILGLILKAFPFLHNHLIGVLHLLMFFSFIVSPLILYRVFRRANLQALSSFMLSLAIGLLAPQFLKINAGHFALAYGCLIPFSMLLLQRYFTQSASWKNTLLIAGYNLFIFLLHPYMGICLSLFTALAFVTHTLIVVNKLRAFKPYLQLALAAFLPIVLFTLFMKLSDSHSNRTKEPFGAEVMVENVSSLVVPDFGPFAHTFESILPAKPGHFEGHSYLGLMSIVATLILLFLLPFHYKKINFKDSISVLFYASLVILCISFGLHQKILKALSINSAAVNQFRAVCRFAWVFYYTLPVFVFVKLRDIFQKLNTGPRLYILPGIALLYLGLNISESSAMFHLNEQSYWKFRNFFNSNLLSPQERQLIAQLKTEKFAAILPLPYFEGGSEMYDRNGSSASMAPGMMYSFHSGKPLYSVMMSRTSITETEAEIDLFNTNHAQRALLSSLKDQRFFVIKTKDPLLPDEERLQKTIKYFAELDSLKFGEIQVNHLARVQKSKTAVPLQNAYDSLLAKNHIVWQENGTAAPYVANSTDNLSTAYVLDSLKLPSGRYIISMQYYYATKEFQNVSCNLIVTENCKGNYKWRDIYPIRKLSGFYNGYAVFEDYVTLSSNCKYEFLLQGSGNRTYHISDFLIRPDTVDVYSIRNKKDTCYNNFPSR